MAMALALHFPRGETLAIQGRPHDPLGRPRWNAQKLARSSWACLACACAVSGCNSRRLRARSAVARDGEIGLQVAAPPVTSEVATSPYEEEPGFQEAVGDVEFADSVEVGAAVVKIFVTRQRPALVVPWQTQQVESTSGSGTFIRRRGAGRMDEHDDHDPLEPPYLHFTDVDQAVENFEGDLVLTAAHVVADARDIRVQLLACPGASPEKFMARVVAVAHDCDLALLEVRDPDCFEGATPMELLKPQEMLAMQSRVQVMGFPIGGDYLSITEGVLSRIEVVDYSHSRRSCLALTVDAAINAGNSGGPVVDPLTGRMTGVAHQKVVARGVENQGHAVPPCLIWRFLYAALHGRPTEMPTLGIYLQTLESRAHREQLQLEAGETGVLVMSVNRRPTDPPSVLKKGDVLLQVGKYKVDNFGAVRMLGQRVALSAAQDLFYVGDVARLRVRRDGKIEELEAELRSSTHLIPRCLYHGKVTIEPEYFIFAGLVFTPLTADLLEQAWPAAQDRPAHLMDLYHRGVMTPERSQAIILLNILADDVNAGHGSGYVGSPVVERVGGQEISDMKELVECLQNEVRVKEFVEMDFRMAVGPYSMVLKSSEVAEADVRIRELYQLPSLASRNLLPEPIPAIPPALGVATG